MAPISAISSTTNPKVSAAKSEANDTESVRDEFSAIFEEFVPGFEDDSGDSSIIDTSFTVVPIQVAQAPVVEHGETSGADDEVVDEEAEIAAEPQREDSDEGGAASSSVSAPVADSTSEDEAEAVDSRESESPANEDIESATVETLIARSDGEDTKVESEDGALVSKLSGQVAAAVDQVEETTGTSKVATVGREEGNESQASAEVVDEVVETQTAPKAEVHAEVKIDKFKDSSVHDVSAHNSHLNRAVREVSETRSADVVQPKIENPVFGETRTEAEELARVMARSSKDSSENTPPNTFEQPRGQNNTPLLEVLMSQVQRLTTQNLGAANSSIDLNLSSKSSIQLGQSAAVTQVGANLSTKTDSDPRSAKIARQFPAAGVRTMERVQKALADAVAAQDGKTISLRLDPPELGQVKVDLSFRGGNLSARIVAESAGVTALLRERAHELQHTLRKLGIEANNVTVSVGVDNEQGEPRTNLEGEREQRGQFGQGSFEQEFVEGLLVEEELQGGKLAMDHRVA